MMPQINDYVVEGYGDSLKMRGLMHVLQNVHTEGMSLDALEMSVALIVQEQLKNSLEGLTSEQAQIVGSFLLCVDNNLTVENQKVVRSGRSM